MGLFSFIGDLLGGNKKAKAAKAAADVQAQAAQAGIDEERRQFDATQALLAPWIQTGTQALGAQSDLVGLGGGDKQAAAIEALKSSPLYQSLFRNGQETILANNSATGGLRGGNIQRSLADFGSDTLAGVIEHQLAQLGGLSGQGVSTAQNQGVLGANASNQIAQLLQGKGQAQAGGILGKANAYLGMYKSGADFLGDIAAAVMGMPGVGSSTVGQFAQKIL